MLTPSEPTPIEVLRVEVDVGTFAELSGKCGEVWQSAVSAVKCIVILAREINSDIRYKDVNALGVRVIVGLYFTAYQRVIGIANIELAELEGNKPLAVGDVRNVLLFTYGNVAK